MSIVSNGLDRQRAVVLLALRSNSRRMSKHRYASVVMQDALLQCPPAECDALASEVLAQAGAAVTLACHNYGIQVVRGLLQVPGASEQTMQYLCKSQRRLEKDMFGAQLLQELCLGGKFGPACRHCPMLGMHGGA
uniref:PUM-HD domain-containing protein n=1 Tax=Zooxanthella nutricula TaxID=1333877 RepID=A0A7S2LE86_9DINO